MCRDNLFSFNFLLLLIFFHLGQSITTFPEHGGAYSLFPHEDLRTGKTLRSSSFDNTNSNSNSRSANINENSQQISSRYRSQFNNDNDNPLRTERQRDNYRSFSTFPVPIPPTSQNYRNIYNNRILFDDERLNFRGGFPRFIESYRRYPSSSIVPASFPEAKLPVRAKIPDELSPNIFSDLLPTRIHVFNPDSNSFVHSNNVEPRVVNVIDKSNNGDKNVDDVVDVRPGRILIPGHEYERHGKNDQRSRPNQNINEPGPDLFLNHDEYLEYHTKIALQELQLQSQQRSNAKDPTDNANRVVLFSPSSINRGLVPPKFSENSDEISSSTSSSASNENDNENESGFFRVKSQKEKRIHVTELLDNKDQPEHDHRPDQEISLETISSSSGKPILESGFVPSRHYYFETGEAKSPRTKAQGISSTTTKVNSTEVGRITTTPIPINNRATATATTSTSRSYPYVKKSSPITRININAITILPPIATTTSKPSTIDVNTEIPLIFLDSKEKVPGNNKGKVIVVKRLKKKKGLDSTSPSSVGTQLKTMSSHSSSLIETTMTVHNQSNSSSEEELNGDAQISKGHQNFILSPKSQSAQGIVSRVHAHITKCPQLYSQAEILCDVHIRKRHGKSNPQLTVGWKRKFYNNETIIALDSATTSKVPAYVEEDFHDKFNVTLASGINPMLRSVLTIKSVLASDTGNYQCEVDDGENLLKSETLLFLCH